MIKSIDTLLAIKAINLAPGLVPSDRVVGVALIEHYNRRSGRCDPGMERLAGLLGLCTRTVLRATKRLVRAGLFKKVSHGGYFNRNSYEPNWQRLAELEAAWRKKMAKRSRSCASGESPAAGSWRHGPGDSAVAQTCSTNLHNRTCSNGHPIVAKEPVRFGNHSAHAAGKGGRACFRFNPRERGAAEIKLAEMLGADGMDVLSRLASIDDRIVARLCRALVEGTLSDHDLAAARLAAKRG